jgi:Tfp pilus assembly protein PilF
MEKSTSVLLSVGLLLLLLLVLLLGISGCSTKSPMTQQQQLAADIYAQLALGYMASGHLALAEQRLNKAIELKPNGALTLKAAKQWRSLHDTQTLEAE